MGVQDKNIHKTAKVALECITLELGATATGQTDLEKDATVPGFAFIVEKVEVYAKTVTAVISVNVRIGSTSVLASAITPVADTPTAGTLTTTLADRRGAATDEINVIYTSNGAGAAVNARVRVWIRPRPMNGEAK